MRDARRKLDPECKLRFGGHGMTRVVAEAERDPLWQDAAQGEEGQIVLLSREAGAMQRNANRLVQI
eukprot:4446274-Alexandrium_andersonii.AAC.1